MTLTNSKRMELNTGPARGRLAANDPDSESFDIDGWLEQVYEDRFIADTDTDDRGDNDNED